MAGNGVGHGTGDVVLGRDVRDRCVDTIGSVGENFVADSNKPLPVDVEEGKWPAFGG